jgi:predicted nucleic acid-binding protein
MKSECNKFIIDSCLLVYLADRTNPEKHVNAIAWLEKSKFEKIVVSSQSIKEFANVCILKGILSPQDTIEFIDSIVSKFVVIQDDYYDTKIALSLCRNNKKLFWDAGIVSVMKRNNIDCILTENIKDFELLGVKAINPLK